MKIRGIIKFFNGKRTRASFVGNRQTLTFAVQNAEYTLTIRDTSQPDQHSREEVFEMLRKVRQAEAEMGWKCPEP